MSKNIKNSPLHFIGGAVQALGAYDWGGKRKAAEAKAQGSYDARLKSFEDQKFENIYGDVSNPYANMQNTMEDATVNQQQAQFQAAGSSGVAGLAQAMANQGSQQAQKASASIGQQESANQRASMQEASKLQTMDRQGAFKADMTRRSGEEQKRQLETNRENTLMAMSADRLNTASGAVQAGKDAMWSGIGSSVGDLAGLAVAASDIRLKENINKTGVSESGIPIYTFNYKGEDQLWSGTMAQDLLGMGINNAVTIMDNGYYGVDYSMIDVDMITKN